MADVPAKYDQIMRNKKQFNVYLRPEVKDHALAVSDSLGWTRNEIVEVALATLFGSRDNLIEAKREKIQKASRQLGTKLPFELPLTPFENKALTL